MCTSTPPCNNVSDFSSGIINYLNIHWIVSFMIYIILWSITLHFLIFTCVRKSIAPIIFLKPHIFLKPCITFSCSDKLDGMWIIWQDWLAKDVATRQHILVTECWVIPCKSAVSSYILRRAQVLRAVKTCNSGEMAPPHLSFLMSTFTKSFSINFPCLGFRESTFRFKTFIIKFKWISHQFYFCRNLPFFDCFVCARYQTYQIN